MLDRFKVYNILRNLIKINYKTYYRYFQNKVCTFSTLLNCRICCCVCLHYTGKAVEINIKLFNGISLYGLKNKYFISVQQGELLVTSTKTRLTQNHHTDLFFKLEKYLLHDSLFNVFVYSAI